MRDDKPAVSEAPARGGRELAAAWADAEARAALNRVAQGMVLLALVLLLGAFLAPNPDVWYTVGPGQSVSSSGWSGLVMAGLRLTGAAAGGGGNLIVSILAVIGGIRACQLASAYHGRPRAGTA